MITRAYQIITRTLLFKIRQILKPSVIKHKGVRLLLNHQAVSPYIRKIVYNGGYESAESAMLEATLEPDDRVLELGSGMGFIATFCAKMLGNGAAVCAIEALPQMEALIRENFRLNGVNPELVMAAIGLDNGECTFTVADNFWSSSAANASANGEKITVPMVALGSLIERFRPTYLVVDVEGMEKTLFQQDLGTVKKICLEIHPHYVGDEGIRKCLMDLFQQGFAVDFLKSSRCVLFLHR
jgi:FkbM family methyltransferase